MGGFTPSCRDSFPLQVRGWIHMDVYCLRDIAAGEELCISYRAHGELDMAVDWRRFRFAQKWGELCTCPRCQRELRELGVEDPDDVAATEVRASAVLEWYNGMAGSGRCGRT